MQRVEDFMQEYFRARTELSRAHGALYQPIAERFLAPSYASFDPDKSVAHSEAETILSVQTLDSAAEVITCGWLPSDHRARYRLSALANSWQITAIEFECFLCHGSGRRKDQKTDCRICKGKGWTLIGQTTDP